MLLPQALSAAYIRVDGQHSVGLPGDALLHHGGQLVSGESALAFDPDRLCLMPLAHGLGVSGPRGLYGPVCFSDALALVPVAVLVSGYEQDLHDAPLGVVKQQ
jgi:hypothetical protein